MFLHHISNLIFFQTSICVDVWVKILLNVEINSRTWWKKIAGSTCFRDKLLQWTQISCKMDPSAGVFHSTFIALTQKNGFGSQLWRWLSMTRPWPRKGNFNFRTRQILVNSLPHFCSWWQIQSLLRFWEALQLTWQSSIGIFLLCYPSLIFVLKSNLIHT